MSYPAYHVFTADLRSKGKKFKQLFAQISALASEFVNFRFLSHKFFRQRLLSLSTNKFAEVKCSDGASATEAVGKL